MMLEEEGIQDTLAFYDLVMIARDASYQPFGDNGEYLQGRNMLDADGRMHDSIRNIILSSVEGEGLEMHLVKPY